jgi:hypothetical protein
MFEKLEKGLVFKFEANKEGKTFYTIILENRFFFSGFNKTAILYKNLEDNFSEFKITKINRWDFRNYIGYYKNGLLKLLDDEETETLMDDIENLPKRERRKIYREEKLKLVNNLKPDLDCSFDFSYGPVMQKISNIS